MLTNEHEREQVREDETRAFRKAIAQERVSALEFPSWVMVLPLIPAGYLTFLTNDIFNTGFGATIIVFSVLYLVIAAICLAVYEHLNS